MDDLGLDNVDRFILEAIVSKFRGGPVGLTTLSIAVGEEPETIEAAYEPFLVQGLVSRTPRGRVATSRTYQHMGFPNPDRPRGRCSARGSSNRAPTRAEFPRRAITDKVPALAEQSPPASGGPTIVEKRRQGW